MSAPENKTLVILRHAHRSKSLGAGADNGLSNRGRKQALAARTFFRRMFSGTKPILYSSPKLRCLQTAEPIARKQKVEVQVLDSLNECITDQELAEKVRTLDRFWRSSRSNLTVFCSHGDVIPALIQQLIGTSIDLDKGGWVQIEMENETPKLRWVVQSYEALL